MRNFENVNLGAPGLRLYFCMLFFWVGMRLVCHPILDICQDVVDGDVENLRNQITFFWNILYISASYLLSSLHCYATLVIVTVVVASFVPFMAASIIFNVKEVSQFI